MPVVTTFKRLLRFGLAFFSHPNEATAYLLVQLLHNPPAIRKIRRRHKGETIFCVGLGPSLQYEDLSLLKGKIVIFLNNSYQLLDRIEPAYSYWLVQDENRLEELKDVDRRQFSQSFRTMHNLNRFRRNLLRKEDVFIKPEFIFRTSGKSLYPDAYESDKLFSNDLSKNICLAGHNVVFSALQIAKYMGATNAVLLGMDFSYGTNANDSYFLTGSSNNTAVSFKPNNFGDIARRALLHYKDVFETEGGQLINCSRTTKENITKKATLEDVINTYFPR